MQGDKGKHELFPYTVHYADSQRRIRESDGRVWIPVRMLILKSRSISDF